jgi:O-methyltransferase
LSILDRLKGAIRASRLEAPARRAVRAARWIATTPRAAGWTRWDPLIPTESFERTVRVAIQRLLATQEPGALGGYLEFGVSRGTSMAAVSRVLDEFDISVPLIGFDSFEGLPDGSQSEGWQPGDFRSTERATRRHLAAQGVDMERVRLVKGWFSDTLTDQTRRDLPLTTASIIMIDCDTHSASLQALRFCQPLIGDEAVIFFDDWEAAVQLGVQGQREAFAEVLTAAPGFVTEDLPPYNENSRCFHLTRDDS